MERDLVGKTLAGKFHILGYLGHGNFGTVWRAEHRVFGVVLREVALKVFNRESGPEGVKEVAALAGILERSKHLEGRRYLIEIYDAGVLQDLDDQPYCAVELARGGSLFTRINRRQSFPLHGALKYMKQIAAGMGVLHSFQPPYVHRDLTPDNILLTETGEVRIADFGLAAMVDFIIRRAPAVGVLSYQAPESLIQGVCTPATDVYSMGLIFYEMLAGWNPFNFLGRGLDPKAASYQGKLIQLQLEARRNPKLLPSPSVQSPELKNHPVLEDIVMRCLSYSPEDRYPSALEVYQDLERFEQGLAPIPPPPGPDSASLLVEEGKYYFRKGMLEEALACWQEALEKNGEADKIYLLIAELCLQEKRPEKALEAALKGLRHKECRDLYHAVARIYDVMGKKDLAASFAREAERCGD